MLPAGIRGINALDSFSMVSHPPICIAFPKQAVIVLPLIHLVGPLRTTSLVSQEKFPWVSSETVKSILPLPLFNSASVGK